MTSSVVEPRTAGPLGLGLMPMSWGYAEGRRDDGESIQVIHAALERGVRLLDTARVYGDGHNEQLLGRALRGRDADVLVATKGGLVVDDLAGRVMRRDARPQTLRRQVDESLSHLGVEVIDLYYLHRVDDAVPLEDSWGALADLVHAGKLRRLGLSEVTRQQADTAHAIHSVAAVQSELSLWTRDALGVRRSTSADGPDPTALPVDDLVGWTADHDALFVAFAPLGRGYLTATLRPDGFEDADFRAANPRFTAEAFTRNATLLAEITDIAVDLGVTPAQVALAWLLTRGRHVLPIPGTRNLAHLVENLGAAGVTLADDHRARLDNLPAPFGTRY